MNGRRDAIANRHETCLEGSGRVRVALLSDTHGRLDPRVEAIVGRCDAAVHAGDIGALAVLEALVPRLGMVIAIRGNNDVEDKWPAAERSALAHLPEAVALRLPGGVLQVVHGDRAGRPAQRHQWLRRAHPQARAVVYGHSHRLCVDRHARPWVLNPGAAGRARTYGGPSCLVLTASEQRWSVRCHRFASTPASA